MEDEKQVGEEPSATSTSSSDDHRKSKASTTTATRKKPHKISNHQRPVQIVFFLTLIGISMIWENRDLVGISSSNNPTRNYLNSLVFVDDDPQEANYSVSAPIHTTEQYDKEDQIQPVIIGANARPIPNRNSWLEQLEFKHNKKRYNSPGFNTTTEMIRCSITNNTKIILPAFPSFIIIGAQKGGTSAMYTWLKRLPGFTASKSFEPHFFDFKIPAHLRNKDPATYTEKNICKLRKLYFDEHFKETGKNPHNFGISFEKTPSYLSYPYTIPQTIHAIVSPKPKLLVSLRDPVERAFSAYKLLWTVNRQRPPARREIIPSFESMVQKSISKLKHNLKGTLMPPLHSRSNWDTADLPQIDKRPPPEFETKDYMDILLRGMYARQLKPYLKLWTPGADIKIITMEDLKNRLSDVLNDILDFLGAPSHDYTAQALAQDLSPYRKTAKLHKDDTPVLSDKTRAYLKRFYKPYNDELADLLGEEYRGIWS